MKILNHLRSLAKIRRLMRIRKRPKTGFEMLALPLVPMAPVCLHLFLHEHLIIQLLPESTTHTSTEAISPLPKASVEGKRRKRKSQESEILPGTAYKTFTESKGKEKASKMK
jgi:hypothetical protein